MALCIEVISLAYTEEIGLFDLFTPHSVRSSILDIELKTKQSIVDGLEPWTNTSYFP